MEDEESADPFHVFTIVAGQIFFQRKEEKNVLEPVTRRPGLIQHRYCASNMNYLQLNAVQCKVGRV